MAIRESTYSKIILILYGVGILGIIFIVGAIVSFAIDSVDRSMTILVVGVVFLSLMALAIDVLERKCRISESGIVHQQNTVRISIIIT